MTESSSSSSLADDVWNSLKDLETERLLEYRKRASALKSKSDLSVVDLIKKSEKKEKKVREKANLGGDAQQQQESLKGKQKAKKKKNVKLRELSDALQDKLGDLDLENKQNQKILVQKLKGDSISSTDAIETSNIRITEITRKATDTTDEAVNKSLNKENKSDAPILIKANEMISKISRDLNLSNSENMNERRKALLKLKNTLFIDNTMSIEDYNLVFREASKPIFKRYSDPSEKCREISLSITQLFFENSKDFVPILAYFFPMLMQRLPGGLAYDEDMKVFVLDMEVSLCSRKLYIVVI